MDGNIRVKGTPAQEHDVGGGLPEARARTRSPRWATSTAATAATCSRSGAGGVQIADVSVDTETGIVKMNRYVAVQDCGMVINPRLAESQVYGAVIMGICTALFEERVMDDADRPHAEPRYGVVQTGRHRRHRRTSSCTWIFARRTTSAA